MSTRAELSETLNRLLPGERDKRIREAILASASYSGSRTDQLRRSIDEANRIKTGLLVNGTLDITTTTNADLQSFTWVVNFVIRQQPALESITIDAPNADFPRPDIFVGLADGSIVYRAGTVDAEGNAQDPTYDPTTEVLLRAVTRNPDNTFTEQDPGAGGDDNVKKSATGTQTIQSNLAIAPQAGGLLDLVRFDNAGKPIRVRPDKAGVYVTEQGTVGWARVIRINTNIPTQLNYGMYLNFSAVESNDSQVGELYFYLRFNSSKVIQDTVLLAFGKVTPARYKIIKINDDIYELWLQHFTSLTLYAWRPLFSFGSIDKYTLFNREPITALPSGDALDFTAQAAKEVQLQTSATHIQWRLVGDPDWINLIALADLKGDDGDDGIDGDDGLNGWTPILAVVTDGERRVHQVTDWTGGTGTKPTTGLYVGTTGLEADIADAVDIRGPEGPAGSGGGGGTGGYTELTTFPVIPFNANYKYAHEMAGAVELSVDLSVPRNFPNHTILYIKADGTNKPTFKSSDNFSILYDGWNNTAGEWNRIRLEWSPQGNPVVQIMDTSGAANPGTGDTDFELLFDADYSFSHVIAGTVSLSVDVTGAAFPNKTVFYFRADGVNKPLWNAPIECNFDNYINEAGVWNRFYLEWTPEAKVTLQIQNT